VCNPGLVTSDPVVIYSFGSNGDFTFEKACYAYFNKNAVIHTFDMAKPWDGTPAYVTYHQMKVTHETLSAFFHNHPEPHIDIFKMDIEGWECSTLIPLLEQRALPDIDQIQLELHWDGGKFPQMGAACIEQLFALLRDNMHMEIFHKEANIEFGRYGFAIEYAFVKIDWPTETHASIKERRKKKIQEAKNTTRMREANRLRERARHRESKV